jgi:hypothetical protein
MVKGKYDIQRKYEILKEHFKARVEKEKEYKARITSMKNTYKFYCEQMDLENKRLLLIIKTLKNEKREEN